MFTQLFWKSAIERAVKTFAQSLVAVLSVGGIGLVHAPWTTALSAAGMATLLSLLTSVASGTVGDRGSPSLVPAQPAPQQPVTSSSVTPDKTSVAV
ncbi:MAG TPA: holin [Mycobacteriales bacterium]|nr:holin [Mycobacteriales bacterium]